MMTKKWSKKPLVFLFWFIAVYPFGSLYSDPVPEQVRVAKGEIDQLILGPGKNPNPEDVSRWVNLLEQAGNHCSFIRQDPDAIRAFWEDFRGLFVALGSVVTIKSHENAAHIQRMFGTLYRLPHAELSLFLQGPPYDQTLGLDRLVPFESDEIGYGESDADYIYAWDRHFTQRHVIQNIRDAANSPNAFERLKQIRTNLVAHKAWHLEQVSKGDARRVLNSTTALLTLFGRNDELQISRPELSAIAQGLTRLLSGEVAGTYPRREVEITQKTLHAIAALDEALNTLLSEPARDCEGRILEMALWKTLSTTIEGWHSRLNGSTR